MYGLQSVRPKPRLSHLSNRFLIVENNIGASSVPECPREAQIDPREKKNVLGSEFISGLPSWGSRISEELVRTCRETLLGQARDESSSRLKRDGEGS